ncbi:MAG: zinc ribbon domain-containing protein [Phycisphaerae bacterium]|nr:zinc ribbon domain-containing protein [Phycisphaerae bacterium]
MKKINPNAGLGIMAIVVPVFFGIFFVIFGILFGAGAMAMGAPFIFGIGGGFFAVIGVCVVISGIFMGIKMKRKIQSGGSFDDMDDVPFDESFSHKLRSGTTVTIKDFDIDTEPVSDAPDDDFEETKDDKGSEKDKDNLFKAGFCTNCGTTAEEGYNFCPKCGKKV